MTATVTAERRAELARQLDLVRQRLAAACADAGRAPKDVTLVVVTKTRPACDVSALAGLGVTDVGEARHPEAQHKRQVTPEPLVWHFVGALQTNKAAAVASYSDIVHSVDRQRLVTALEHGADRHDRRLDALVQVSLDPPGTPGLLGPRSGADPAEVAGIANAVAGCEHLRLRGLMAVAPREGDPSAAFERLAQLAAAVRADHPAATVLSAGMSGDFEQAVAAGATHVRVGRAILGERPSLQ